MKKISFIFLFLTISFAISAQDYLSIKNEIAGIKKEINLLRKSSRQQIFVQDSSRNFNWDTITNEFRQTPSSKRIYFHDNMGRITGWDLYQKKDTGWQKKNELRMVFDQNGNMTEWIYNRYSSVAGMLIPFEHDSLYYNSSNILIREDWYICTSSGFWYKEDSYIYDDSGNLKEWCYTDYDWTTQEIFDGIKELYEYNSNNKQTDYVYQQYVTSDNTWKNVRRETRTYTDTLINSAIHYDWNGNDWFPNTQYSYLYENNVLIEFILKHYVSGSWVNSNRVTYSYTSNGKVSQELSYSWNFSSWNNNYKTDYSYNSSGLLIEKLEQMLSYSWENVTKEVYEYDSQNRQTNYCSYDWISEEWQKHFETHKSFDNAGNVTEDYRRYYIDFFIEYSSRYLYTYDQNNLFTEEIVQEWNIIDNNWRSNYKTVNYYSPFLIGINEISGNTCTCTFSNPLKNGDVISCASLKAGEIYDLKLYSLSGQIVFRQSFTSAEQIRIDKPLTAGLYLMVISDNTGIVYSGKTLFSR